MTDLDAPVPYTQPPNQAFGQQEDFSQPSIGFATQWSFEEDELLREMTEKSRKHGAIRWSLVESAFPTRSSQECRCRWRRMVDAESRLKRGVTPRNKCNRCGELRRGHSCTKSVVKSYMYRDQNATPNNNTLIAQKRIKKAVIAQMHLQDTSSVQKARSVSTTFPNLDPYVCWKDASHIQIDSDFCADSDYWC